MSVLIMSLIVALCFWMALCALCGFRRRILLFLGTLLTGITLNQIWMMGWLNAKPFEVNAVMAQVSLVMYGVSAFGAGWLVSRVVKAWADSRVNDPQV